MDGGSHRRLSSGRSTPGSRSRDLRKVEEMRQVIEAVWPIFDTDGSMSIETVEFVARDGLADTIIASIDHL